MTSVEIAWSLSGNDETFLEDMKTAMKDVSGVEAMKIAYDPKSHAFLGDSCAPWLAFLKDHVVNSSSIRKIVFDVPYNFTPYGDAGPPFRDLMNAIDDAARKRGVDVTIYAYPDMKDTIMCSMFL
jgi:hypothetical protein